MNWTQSVRYSVGIVGLREHLNEMEMLRQELSDDVYLWVNAYKRTENYYQQDELERIEGVDPLFRINAIRHPSLGKECQTGETVISVDGAGDVRRCHFVDEVIGNIFSPDFEQCLKPRTCTNAVCGCHIGYVHLEDLGLGDVFTDGLIERIPYEALWRDIDKRQVALRFAKGFRV